MTSSDRFPVNYRVKYQSQMSFLFKIIAKHTDIQAIPDHTLLDEYSCLSVFCPQK